MSILIVTSSFLFYVLLNHNIQKSSHQSTKTLFWLRWVAYDILTSWPGMEPTSPAVEARVFHWTVREVLKLFLTRSFPPVKSKGHFLSLTDHTQSPAFARVHYSFLETHSSVVFQNTSLAIPSQSPLLVPPHPKTGGKREGTDFKRMT